MSSTVTVRIHPSQFPEAVRRDLLESLRTRQVNHKFHYDSVKQTQKWLALHQAYSPSRNDADCAATYDRAFAGAVAGIKAKRVHVIGLGCGGGQKDTRLLQQLRAARHRVFYTPSDVSVAMTLVARNTAAVVVPDKDCFPLVCDLTSARDLAEVLAAEPVAGATRLITFFGMIPNFEPDEILAKLAKLVRRGDSLLFSANLAPGRNYAAGMEKILPQYDNVLTREWLLTFLTDLGVERRAGALRFGIESGKHGLKRVVARFEFTRACSLRIESEAFTFRRGESIRLFFSYRYTAARVRRRLARHGLTVQEQFMTESEEEGVFLCHRR